MWGPAESSDGRALEETHNRTAVALALFVRITPAGTEAPTHGRGGSLNQTRSTRTEAIASPGSPHEAATDGEEKPVEPSSHGASARPLPSCPCATGAVRIPPQRLDPAPALLFPAAM